ncbi:septum formation initiator family protein [Actinotalea sp.]|uniref:FtsB family cell division protein n=1 Tax=Actinotalea sp. TaxID=1872145 RepID=UPI003562D9F9
MSRRPASPRARAATGASGHAGRPASHRPVSAPSAGARRRDTARSERGSGEDLPSRARIFSIRSIVLGVTLLFGFIIVFPTVQSYLGQQELLGALAADVAAAEQRETDLQSELDRWGTDAYVVAQARERLGYVMPGETAYRVIDPEVVVEAPAVQSTDPEATSGAALPIGGSTAPWYSTIWDSVELAGASGVADADGTDDGAGE